MHVAVNLLEGYKSSDGVATNVFTGGNEMKYTTSNGV